LPLNGYPVIARLAPGDLHWIDATADFTPHNPNNSLNLKLAGKNL
jgi:hypothetical protein